MMGALTGMLLAQHASRGRVVAMGAAGVVMALLGVAILVGDGALDAARGVVEEAGFALLVPVVAAVFATSVLGDPAEDGTLGHLLTTPQPRWRLALPALAATCTVVLPLAVVPVLAVLGLNGAPVGTVAAYTTATILAALAYSSIFTALGLAVRRGLLVALVYTAVWEGIVSRFGTGLARLSVRQYTMSALAGLRDRAVPADGVAGGVAITVLLGLVVVGAVGTTLLLRGHRTRA